MATYSFWTIVVSLAAALPLTALVVHALVKAAKRDRDARVEEWRRDEAQARTIARGYGEPGTVHKIAGRAYVVARGEHGDARLIQLLDEENL